MGDRTFLVDGWEIDPIAHEMVKANITRRIEPKAMQVLVLLAQRPGAVVSRSELLDDVWGGAFVGDDAVSAAVIKLRRAFEDDARSPRVIETVHKSGYRLIAPVATSRSEPSDQGVERAEDATPSIKTVTLLRCTYHAASLEAASADLEAWQQATDAIAFSLGGVIERHGGTAIRESGAIIGVFGAPNALEHHAMRAVQAALDIRAAMDAPSVRGVGRLRHTWKIGVASGEILSAATRAAGELAVHGAPVAIASALVAACEPGEVLIAGETRGLAHGLSGAHLCNPSRFGPELGDVFALGRDARWSNSWEARVERGLTPLFGRDYELDRIHDLLGRVRNGEGQVLALVGEAGAGKSRLVHEALAFASRNGFDALVAAASPIEMMTPFFSARSPVLDRLGLDHDTADASSLETQLEANGLHCDDIEAVFAALWPDRVDDAWAALDPDLRRSRCVAALSSVILTDNDRPQLIVFEDLHWAGEATRHLVESVVTRIARSPCMVILTYRPGFSDPWAGRSYYSSLRIGALGQVASAEMMDHLAGDHPSVERWKADAVGLAGGTPLFIEELVRSAYASGRLRREGATTVLVEDQFAETSSSSKVPPSVRALIAERVDRLSDGAREILSLAAVIGQDVPAVVLHSLISTPITDRAADFEELQAAELLFASRYRREAGYVFKHALTQEVAYQEIPPSIRAEHHGAIAEALTAVSGDGAQHSAELLARHRSGAGQHELAVEAWLRAAEAAGGAAAFGDALGHLDHARSDLAHVARAHRPALALAIELLAMSLLIQTVGPGDPEVDAVCRTARALALEHGTPRQQYEAMWGSWFVHLMRGEVNAARPIGDRVFELAAVLDDEPLQLEAHHVQWSGLSLAGDPHAVREHARICIERYDPATHHWLTHSYGGHDPGVCARNLDAMALWLLGEPGRARQRSAMAIELAAELGHSYTRLESFNAALNIALLDGDAHTLLAHADTLQALVDEGSLPDFATGYANGFRANALVLSGDLASGLAQMIDAAPVWREFWGAWCFPLDSALAITLAHAGRAEEALDHVGSRLALAGDSGAHWWDAEFHRVRGEILVMADPTDLDRAAASLQRSLEISRQQPAPCLELRAASSLTRLTSLAADADPAAVAALREACNRFAPDADTADLRLARALLRTADDGDRGRPRASS